MKEKLIGFLKLPPVVAVLIIIIYVLIGPHLKSPAEKVSVENFLYYHSTEEIIEYIARQGDLRYWADEIEAASGGEYYCLTVDEADDLVNQSYAYGYYHGAIHESEFREEWGYDGYYQELTDAISRGDFDMVYEYTAGSYYASDFLE